MADERRKESRRGTHPRSLQNLRPVRKGEVRNPKGVNGFTAAVRFRALFERVASDEKLIELASACFTDDRLRAMILERLMPKVDRLELGGIGETEQHERAAAAARLQQLLDAKAKT